MLGYSKKDIFEMQDALDIAVTDYLENGNNEVARLLVNTSDLLAGLLAEGHI